jgi:hypothetical protein
MVDNAWPVKNEGFFLGKKTWLQDENMREGGNCGDGLGGCHRDAAPVVLAGPVAESIGADYSDGSDENSWRSFSGGWPDPTSQLSSPCLDPPQGLGIETARCRRETLEMIHVAGLITAFLE